MALKLAITKFETPLNPSRHPSYSMSLVHTLCVSSVSSTLAMSAFP